MEIIVHLEANFDSDGAGSSNYIHAQELSNLENNSCDKIDLTDSLEFTEDPDSLIKLAISKLRLDGVILIHGNDIFEISRLLTTLQLSPRKACSHIYMDRKILFGAFEVKKILENLGISILDINIDDIVYKIEGQRQ